jgi:hypothetical protein
MRDGREDGLDEWDARDPDGLGRDAFPDGDVPLADGEGLVDGDGEGLGEGVCEASGLWSSVSPEAVPTELDSAPWSSFSALASVSSEITEDGTTVTDVSIRHASLELG